MWKENLGRNLSFQKVQRSKSKLSRVVTKQDIMKSDTNQAQATGQCKQDQGDLPDFSRYNRQYSLYNLILEPSPSHKQFQVRQVLARFNTLQKKTFLAQAKDLIQPKQGDLQIYRMNKFNQQGLESSRNQNSSNNNQSLNQIEGMPNNRERQFEDNIRPNYENGQDNRISSEVLRVKNLKNLSCRPTKGADNISFNKQNSSILQKRKQKSSLSSSESKKEFQDDLKSSQVQKYNDIQVDEQFKIPQIFQQQMDITLESILESPQILTKNAQNQLEIISEESFSNSESSDELNSCSDMSFYQMQEEKEDFEEGKDEKGKLLQEQIILLFLSISILIITYLFWFTQSLKNNTCSSQRRFIIICQSIIFFLPLLKIPSSKHQLQLKYQIVFYVPNKSSNYQNSPDLILETAFYKANQHQIYLSVIRKGI